MSSASSADAGTNTPRWVVVNQSQSPMFQRMLERLARRIGSCLLLTGTPFDVSPGAPLAVWRGPAYQRTGVRGRLLSWLKFEAWAARRLRSIEPPVFVLAVSNPPWNAQLAGRMARRGSEIGLLVWDIYPDHVVRMGWMGERNPVVRAWRRSNAALMRRARVVITLGDAMAHALKRQAPGVPVHVVPNWADTETFRPIDRDGNPFVREHALADVFCVLYSGNMGGSHGMESIARAAALLRDREDIRFVLIGDGLGRASVERVVTEERLDNVLLLPPQPWDALPWSITAGHVGIVSQSAASDELSVPSKTYTLLAAGVPVLAVTPDASDLAALVRSRGVGLVSAPDDAEALAANIRELADDPARRAAMAGEARAAALGEFSEDAIFERLLEVLATVPGLVQ